MRLAANVGRARGRNRLAGEARSPHLLFLDADMLPDSETFVADWLAVATQDAAVAFGGFSFRRTPLDRRFSLHRAMALRSDCLPSHVSLLDPRVGFNALAPWGDPNLNENCTLVPAAGMLLLWPGYLRHCTRVHLARAPWVRVALRIELDGRPARGAP